MKFEIGKEDWRVSGLSDEAKKRILSEVSVKVASRVRLRKTLRLTAVVLLPLALVAGAFVVLMNQKSGDGEIAAMLESEVLSGRSMKFYRGDDRPEKSEGKHDYTM